MRTLTISLWTTLVALTAFSAAWAQATPQPGTVKTCRGDSTEDAISRMTSDPVLQQPKDSLPVSAATGPTDANPSEAKRPPKNWTRLAQKVLRPGTEVELWQNATTGELVSSPITVVERGYQHPIKYRNKPLGGHYPILSFDFETAVNVCATFFKDAPFRIRHDLWVPGKEEVKALVETGILEFLPDMKSDTPITNPAVTLYTFWTSTPVEGHLTTTRRYVYNGTSEEFQPHPEAQTVRVFCYGNYRKP